MTRTSDDANSTDEGEQSSVCLICQDPEGMQDPVRTRIVGRLAWLMLLHAGAACGAKEQT